MVDWLILIYMVDWLILCLVFKEWFGLVWFCGVSTIVGYLMPNLLYTYVLDINDL